MDPSSVQGAILWGIVAGLATSALILLVTVLMSRAILPWYQTLIYQGVDLRGIWTQDTTDRKGHFSIQISLQQHAHRITGTGTLTRSGSGAHDYVQFFTVDGSTWEGFLTINMRSQNRTSLSFVAGLLKVTNRGASLVGHWVYRAAVIDEAVSEALNLTRQGRTIP